MEAKKRLAVEMVERFCGPGEGVRARSEFENVFSGKKLPDEIQVAEIAWEGERMRLAKIIALSGAAKSNSEARRLIQQGAVEVNEASIKEMDLELPEGEYILKVGKKRFVRVVAKK